MAIKVLAFGIAKEIFGSDSIDIQLEGNTTAENLKSELLQQYPGLKRLTSFMIAVNSEYALPSAVISAGDEVAIIPPVSGG